MFLGQTDGPVRVVAQSEERQVDAQRGAEQEEREQDERECLALDPGASGVELPHHQEADNEAQETLVGEVGGDVDP